MRPPFRQAFGDQAVDDPRHGGPGNSFGSGQGAQRAWPAEDEDRERGEPGRGQAGLPVNGPEAAQQVDRAGAECRRGGLQVKLASCHPHMYSIPTIIDRDATYLVIYLRVPDVRETRRPDVKEHLLRQHERQLQPVER